MNKIFAFGLLFLSLSLFAQDSINIIPAPVNYKVTQGKFLLDKQTTIVLNDSGDLNSARFLNNYLEKFYSLHLAIAKSNSPAANAIVINTKKFIKAPANEGAYTLYVNPKTVVVQGDSYAGTFYGIQTLLRLLPLKAQTNLAVPCVSIEDYPRFKYRGMHLDVGRHFMPVDFVKKYIDYLAYYKMNTFHWHLTEDQGWRIEIKKYPLLTSVGGFRNGTIVGHHPGTGNDNTKSGGFYTQEEIKDVVKYASERFITVVPEIELPGHSSAAIAAYPQLSCFPDEPTKPATGSVWSGSQKGKQVQQAWGVYDDVFSPTEYTFTFLENVLDEVMQLFPSEYIHVGGDECPKENWKRSAFCQQLIKDKGLKDEHGLQSYFIQRIEKYINSKGRKIIGWDEILEGGLAPNATVMSWRGEQGGIDAAKQNHDVIMTPGSFVYFDHAQSKSEDSLTIGGYLPIETVYSYDPVPKELDSMQAKHVLGAQANVWTEYMANPKKVEYMIFPRISALSEVLWSAKGKKNYDDFQKRLIKEFSRYDIWNTNYSKAYYNLRSKVEPIKSNLGVLWSLESKSNGQKFITNTKTNAGMKYTEPILINGAGNYEAALMDNNKVLSVIHQNFLFNKATGKQITIANQPATRYPGNGGSFGLVNGLKAENQFPSDEWLGWSNTNLEAIINLGKPEVVSKVSIGVFQREKSQIYLPAAMQVSTSDDGTTWTNTIQQNETEKPWSDNKKITLAFAQPAKAKYIKVVAVNKGASTQNTENAKWLFADEIEVE